MTSATSQCPQDNKSVKELVDEFAPWGSDDDDYTDTKAYLCSLLESDDKPTDEEELCETIQQFFDDTDASQALVRALMQLNVKESNEEKKPLHVVSSQHAAEGQKRIVVDEAPIPISDNDEKTPAPATKTRGKDKRDKKARKRAGKKSPDRKTSPNRKASPNRSPHSPTNEGINEVVARLNETSAQELNEMDDYSSAWEQAKAEGRVWGGRGYGGRGVNRGLGVNKGKDAVVNQLTLSFGGRDLLFETHLVISHGHRYGLQGQNGVGKSTLLRRIASRSVPGWPLHLSVQMVEQEILGSSNSVVECMKEVKSGERQSGNRKREELEAELAELEALLEDEDVMRDSEKMEATAERISEIYDQLEAMDAELNDVPEDKNANGSAFSELDSRAQKILKGLQFKGSMLNLPVNNLSGGWRMRLALAQALYSEPDILLLDEPTNHLDLSAILFLEDYIVKNDFTVVVVSHDGHFLDAVCTDMIKFENCKLKYHVGNYSSFQEMEEQSWARNRSKADAVARKEKKAKEFIQKQKSMSNSKHRDDNKQRQAKEREKKLGRIGLYSENGQKFKLLAEGNTKKGGSNRAGHIFGNYTTTSGMQSAFVKNEQVAFGEDRQLLNFKFPAAAPLKGGGSGSGQLPLITMEDCRFRYGNDAKTPWLLRDMTLNVSNGSRIAVVGKNGAGKSTLLKLLCGELPVSGTFHRHANLKVAHISQHHIEHLGAYLECTPVDYFMQQHNAKNEQEVRQFLGGFGLVGPLALQLIGTLSGGQKARLAFATVMYTVPHVLILDEPTNHLDRDSLESLAAAVEKFQGAVVMVSHNQSFMSSCAKEMWTVGNGHVKVQVADGEVATFDDLFEEYKEGLRKELTATKKR